MRRTQPRGTFTWAQEITAHARGHEAMIRARARGARDNHGLPSSEGLMRHVEGARAEVAAGYVYDAPLQPLDLAYKDHPDVGWFDVRSTMHRGGGLIAHEDDPDDRPICLVILQVRSALLHYRIPGWCYGYEAKQPHYWWTRGRWPCFLVPQGDLRDPATLEDLRR